MRRGFLNSKKAASKPSNQPGGANTPSPTPPRPVFIQFPDPTKNLGPQPPRNAAEKAKREEEEQQRLVIMADANLARAIVPRYSDNDPSVEQSVCYLFYPDNIDALLKANIPIEPPKLLSPLPYVIKKTKKAGLGVFATRNIQAGELILRERPLLVAPQKMPTQKGNEEIQRRYFSTIIRSAVEERLRPENRKIFHSLHNCKNYPGDLKFLGVFETNALRMGPIPGSEAYDVDFAGVFSDISRINHSCSPNAMHCWDLKTFTMSIRALYDIKEGEEISITYMLAGTMLRSERQADTLQKYGFICECTTCSLPLSKSKESDKRRQAIERGYNSAMACPYSKWFEDVEQVVTETGAASRYTLDKALDLNQRYLKDMTEERSLVKELYKLHLPKTIMLYSAKGDADQVRLSAKRMALLETIFEGNDMGWNQVAENPEKTIWWKRGSGVVQA